MERGVLAVLRDRMRGRRVLVMVRVPSPRYHPPMAKPDRLATMAMTMLQTLHVATGGRLEWRGIDLVVSQPEHYEALEYAVSSNGSKCRLYLTRFASQQKAVASSFGDARRALTRRLSARKGA